MSKVSLYFESDEIFALSLQALRQRAFRVQAADPLSGTIKATVGDGLIRPRVSLEIHIQNQNNLHSSLQIDTSIERAALFRAANAAETEARLVSTIFNLLDKRGA